MRVDWSVVWMECAGGLAGGVWGLGGRVVSLDSRICGGGVWRAWSGLGIGHIIMRLTLPDAHTAHFRAS